MTFDEVQKLIKKGDIVALRRELDAGLSANLLNESSMTLLMAAASEGDVRTGELLIAREADVDAMNDAGETALAIAARGGHAAFVRMLLASGASSDSRPKGASLEDQLRVTSGLSKEKLKTILNLLSEDLD